MSKKSKLIIILICLLVLLIPFPMNYKDGGTVRWQAVLYSLTFWHSFDERYESGYYEATELRILGIKIFEISG